MPLINPSLASQKDSRGYIIANAIQWQPSDNGKIVLDFSTQGHALNMQSVRSVFIDNTRGVGQVIMTLRGFGYTIPVEPGQAGIFPVYGAGMPYIELANKSTGGITTFVMASFEQSYMTWEPQVIAQAVTDTTLENVVVGEASAQALRVSEVLAPDILSAISSISELLEPEIKCSGNCRFSSGENTAQYSIAGAGYMSGISIQNTGDDYAFVSITFKSKPNGMLVYPVAPGVSENYSVPSEQFSDIANVAITSDISATANVPTGVAGIIF